MLSQARYTKRGIHLFPMWIQSHSLSSWEAALSGLKKKPKLGNWELGIMGNQGPEKMLECEAALLLGGRGINLVQAPWLCSNHFSVESLNIKLRISALYENTAGFEGKLWIFTGAVAWEKKWNLPLLITPQHFRGKGWLWLPRSNKYLVSLERMGAHFPILTDCL